MIPSATTKCSRSRQNEERRAPLRASCRPWHRGRSPSQRPSQRPTSHRCPGQPPWGPPRSRPRPLLAAAQERAALQQLTAPDLARLPWVPPPRGPSISTDYARRLGPRRCLPPPLRLTQPLPVLHRTTADAHSHVPPCRHMSQDFQEAVPTRYRSLRLQRRRRGPRAKGYCIVTTQNFCVACTGAVHSIAHVLPARSQPAHSHAGIRPAAFLQSQSGRPPAALVAAAAAGAVSSAATFGSSKRSCANQRAATLAAVVALPARPSSNSTSRPPPPSSCKTAHAVTWRGAKGSQPKELALLWM